jgi:hypothetical protein
MKKSFSKLFLAPLTVLVLTSFAMTPVAEARDGGGGGGRGGGGGGARASAGGGGGAHAGGGGGRQVNHANTDARANNVRNSSANNVNSSRNANVNKNVNVNANRNVNVSGNNYHGGGCCNNGWDNDYHPVATAAAVVGTAAIIGSMVRTVPANCVPVNYGGMVYQQCGSTWYQPQGGQYVVINPPY